MSTRQASEEDLHQVVDALRRHDRIVIVSHVYPDPDAYGSSCGLRLALESIGKTVFCVNESGSLSDAQFIPGVSDVQDIMPEERTLLVVCDCGDEKRVGDTFVSMLSEFKEVINIDHHNGNTLFGTLNLVRPGLSSTAELVFRVIEELGIRPTPDIATALFAGMMADTGSFQYESVTADTYRVAAELVGAGAAPYQVAQALYYDAPRETVLYQAYAIEQMELRCQGRVGIVTLLLKDAERFGVDVSTAKPVVEKVRSIRGIAVSVLIYEQDDFFKVSLRSRSDADDVSAVARAFGGGGHKQAAAFRWRGSVKELMEGLESELALVVG